MPVFFFVSPNNLLKKVGLNSTCCGPQCTVMCSGHNLLHKLLFPVPKYQYQIAPFNVNNYQL